MGLTKGSKKMVIKLLDDSSNDDVNQSNVVIIDCDNVRTLLESLESPNSETNISQQCRSRQEGKVALKSKR